MDLFGLQDEGDPLPDTPLWGGLPETVRQRATALMTQLFLEHLQTGADADHDRENDDV